MADTPFPLARAAAIWLTLVALESIHGVMRRLVLEPHLGDLPARQMSVLIGADRIASDFDPRRGGFLALGMLVILVAPRVLAERLGLIQGGQRPNVRKQRDGLNGQRQQVGQPASPGRYGQVEFGRAAHGSLSSRFRPCCSVAGSSP